MNRLLGIASAMLLGLLLLVPVVAAAEPFGRSERFLVVGGADLTLAAGERVDLFVVYDGHARIEGEARTIVVVNGTADLVGAHAGGIVVIQGAITIDAASVVAGDVRTFESTVTAAPGATLAGPVLGLGPDHLVRWLEIGSVLFFVYLAFAISALMAGIVVAGVAARQVRAATDLIRREPVQVVGAAILGLFGVIVAGIAAIVTVVGIPFGIGLLAVVLPGLLVAGYIVAGVWLGEQILAGTSPGVVRERPYLAAAIGLTIVGAISIVPGVGGLISLVGLGAVVLPMWRGVRRNRRSAATARGSQQVAEAVG